MKEIQDALTALQANLLTLVVPIGVIGIILWYIAGAVQPLIPEWGQSIRGYFQRLMLGLAIAGGATFIVTAFYGLLNSK